MIPHDTAPAPDLVAGLQTWARGVYATEAAVELLARSFGGRLAELGYPWIMTDAGEGWCWLEPDQLTGPATAGLSGGERRLLAIVASLAGGRPVDLSETLAGLDRDAVVLVLAAVAHASGSHEHADMVIDSDRGVAFSRGRLPSLYPWPKTTPVVSS
jgi:hypothetical protein